jgi:hypothetical protein
MNNAPRRRRAILISDRPENEARTIPDVIDSRWDRKDMLVREPFLFHGSHFSVMERWISAFAVSHPSKLWWAIAFV